MLTERQAELLQTLEDTFKSMNSTSNDDFFFLDEVLEESDENKKKADEIEAYNKAFKENAIEEFEREVSIMLDTMKYRYDFLSSLEFHFSDCWCDVYNHYTKDGRNYRRRLFGIEIRHYVNKFETPIVYNRVPYQRFSYTEYFLKAEDDYVSFGSKSLDSLFRSDYFKKVMKKEYERRA